jgi:exodeoxyribonuclease V alpha subunit
MTGSPPGADLPSAAPPRATEGKDGRRPPPQGGASIASVLARREHGGIVAKGQIRGRFIVAYLATNRRFVGIGQAKATLLWKTFGPDLHRVLSAGDHSTLTPLLGAEVARHLIEAWREDLAERDIVVWLDEHGFDVRLAWKVLRVWGSAGPEKLRSNPYVMLTFASWRAVDEAARQIGIGQDDPRRLIGAVEAALYDRLDRKHTRTPAETLHIDLSRRLGTSPARLDEAIGLAVLDGGAVPTRGGYQPAGAAVMERFVEREIIERMDSGLTGDLFLTGIDDLALDSILAGFENIEGYTLTVEQRDAVRMALKNPVSVLCGGAGVGKTTVLKAIHTACERHGRGVVQMALAGRAAQRMREATGRDASTVALFLNRVADGGINVPAGTLLIVDEASMIDLPTAYRILRAIPATCSLLLVGDPHQLPPIGFGLFFHVLAVSPSVPRVELTRVHRQDETTGIPAVAASIRAGIVPRLPGFRPDHQGVSFIPASAESLISILEASVADLGGFGGVQILSPLRQGPVGALAINAHFHTHLTSGRRRLPHCLIAEGEPVIWTKNDRERGLANGTLGRVATVSATDDWSCAVDFEGRIHTLDGPEAIHAMELAYAISVHKSQGSQFPVVLIPIFRSRLLDRALIYTAVTRATTKAVLVGDPAAFADAVTSPASSDSRMIGLRL